MTVAARSLELFFIDGRPDGMLTAEVFNWTGHVLRIPRTQLKEGLSREEAAFTGVYILLGETDGREMAYVGEAENMRDRIRNHAAQKDWWDRAVLVTTTANNLHKAHIKYLESRLVEIANSINANALENGNTPPRSSMNEASISNMESFLDTLLMVLPAIRVDQFLSKKRSVSEPSPSPAILAATRFTMKVPRHGVHATAELRNGEMVVLAGSLVRNSWVGDPNHNSGYSALRQELVDGGIISSVDGHTMLTENFAFSSPSAAAAEVAGRSTNGRSSWARETDGKTYAEWEAESLGEQTE